MGSSSRIAKEPLLVSFHRSVLAQKSSLVSCDMVVVGLVDNFLVVAVSVSSVNDVELYFYKYGCSGSD